MYVTFRTPHKKASRITQARLKKHSEKEQIENSYPWKSYDEEGKKKIKRESQESTTQLGPSAVAAIATSIRVTRCSKQENKEVARKVRDKQTPGSILSKMPRVAEGAADERRPRRTVNESYDVGWCADDY